MTQDKISKPTGRSLNDFLPLLPAEGSLRAACRRGDFAELGVVRPSFATADNRIRAEFLRFVALGGDERVPIHERGVQVRGAWIEGKMDFEGGRIPFSFWCLECHFTDPPVFRDATVSGTLSLAGSNLPGLRANRLVCVGSLFMRDGFVSGGEVHLLAAEVGGSLSCKGGSFDGQKKPALSADRMVVAGGVYLNDGFSAKGGVRLPGAKLGGNLECDQGKFDGQGKSAIVADGISLRGNLIMSNKFSAKGGVSLIGAEIAGNFQCNGGDFDGQGGNALYADGLSVKGSIFMGSGFSAKGTVSLKGAKVVGNFACCKGSFEGQDKRALSADGMVIEGAFYFYDLEKPVNDIHLSSCRVGRLKDDVGSWGEGAVLDGFSYRHLAGGAPTDAVRRLAWLKKQRKSHLGEGKRSVSSSDDPADDFRPQPWQQLIRTLRAMGHEEDARQIAIEREKHLFRIGKIGKTPAAWTPLRATPYRWAARCFHWVFGALIAYGYRPLRLVAWMFIVWLTCAGIYWGSALGGIFAPSNPLVFLHPAYAHCSPDTSLRNTKPKVGNWYLCPELAGEYTGFSPLAYSADIILPLVNLQQELDWAPIIPTPIAPWYQEFVNFSPHHLVRLVVWFEILFGWVASLLLVAVLSGLTNRDKD